MKLEITGEIDTKEKRRCDAAVLIEISGAAFGACHQPTIRANTI